MSKVCALTGKRPQTGHNVSHSNRKTQRRFLPNLVTKKIVDPATGKTIKVKLSLRAQRTLLKNPSKFTTQLRKLVAKKQSR
jgi:large subunit ribosomal protein L28